MLLNKWELIKRERDQHIDKELEKINKHANCVGCPSSWFFPDDSQGGQPKIKPGSDTYNAYMTCKVCVVKDECLAFARTHKCVGIWGGKRFNYKGEAKIKIKGE